VVVVRRFRVHELAGEVTGELEDLAGVAVVEAEDGGSSGGLDAPAGEAEIWFQLGGSSGLPVGWIKILKEFKLAKSRFIDQIWPL
jgi:hypothetical protein